MVAVLVGVVAHVALAVGVYNAPESVREKKSADRTEVRTFKRDVVLNKPKPKPVPPKPAPKSKQVPTPKPDFAPAKPVEAKPVEAKPVAKTKPRRAKKKAAPRRSPRAKRSQKRRKVANRKPKTLALTNLGGSSAVKAYQGQGDDSFGSPEVLATPESVAPDAGPKGEGSRDSKGQSQGGDDAEDTVAVGAAPVPPKVVERVYGTWPADAPRGKRPISIMLSLTIDKRGRVAQARIRSRPPAAGRYFDKEAIRVAKATRFKPATLRGQPMDFTIRYVVRFKP